MIFTVDLRNSINIGCIQRGNLQNRGVIPQCYSQNANPSCLCRSRLEQLAASWRPNFLAAVTWRLGVCQPSTEPHVRATLPSGPIAKVARGTFCLEPVAARSTVIERVAGPLLSERDRSSWRVSLRRLPLDLHSIDAPSTGPNDDVRRFIFAL
jgi:hypothetical protein